MSEGERSPVYGPQEGGREVGRSGGSPCVLPDSGTHEPPSETREGNKQGEEGDSQAPLKARGNWPLPNGHITRKPSVRCAFISY